MPLSRLFSIISLWLCTVVFSGWATLHPQFLWMSFTESLGCGSTSVWLPGSLLLAKASDANLGTGREDTEAVPPSSKEISTSLFTLNLEIALSASPNDMTTLYRQFSPQPSSSCTCPSNINCTSINDRNMLNQFFVPQLYFRATK